ncbi:MAG: peptide-methionine (R)-S-oxide reductase MsrB [Gammaproteobacteria bacterium]|nr:peptide-methionine (R)-S-oxide reductase MsrB [Gammaproteobacteria bacterium]
MKNRSNLYKNISKSEEDWLKELGEDRYIVLRKKGTERPFSGKYCNFKDNGGYKCGACGQLLFLSTAKYDSGCGWPSFFQPAKGENVTEIPDYSHGMSRIEVVCSRCDSHLGHVFDDGPKETGLRYCINSISLNFEEME